MESPEAIESRVPIQTCEIIDTNPAPDPQICHWRTIPDDACTSLVLIDALSSRNWSYIDGVDQKVDSF